MLHAPPEAYLISWILLYHPGPPASLFDCLLLWPGLGVVSMWACRGLQSPQGTSITNSLPPTLPAPSGLSGGWPGRPLVRAGFFRPRPLPCLLHLISSSLHPSVSLPSQTVKACEGYTLSLHVPVCASLFLAPSLGACSLVCSVCGALLLIRWLLPCLLCGEQSSCTSETLEAEWSLKVCSLSAGECFWPAY